MNAPDRSLYRFLRASAGTGAMRIAGLVAVMALHVVIARLLGDTQTYGHYAWLSSLLFLVGGLLGFGAPLMATRIIARMAVGPADPRYRMVQAWAERRVLVGAVLTVVFGGLMGLWGLKSEEGFSLTWLVVMAAPLVTLITLQQGLGQAARRLFWAFGPFILMRPVLTLAAVLGVWLFAPAYFGVSAIIGVVVAVLTLLFVLQRAQLSLGVTYGYAGQRPDVALRQELQRGSFFFYLQRVANVIAEHGYTFALGILVDPAAAALYFAAERLARLVTVPQQFNSWFLRPEIAAQGDNTRLQHLTAQASAVSLAMGVVVAVALAGASFAVLGLFGDDFAAARPLLLVMIAGHVADLACGPVRDLLAMRAREHNLLLLSLTSLAVQTGSIALLVPSYGALGAAWSLAITLLVVNLLGMLLVRRSLGLAVGLPSFTHLGRTV